MKGAVWTVDDSEFYKRRPQRASSARNIKTATPQQLSDAQRAIAGQGVNMQNTTTAQFLSAAADLLTFGTNQNQEEQNVKEEADEMIEVYSAPPGTSQSMDDISERDSDFEEEENHRNPLQLLSSAAAASISRVASSNLLMSHSEPVTPRFSTNEPPIYPENAPSR